VPPEADLAEAIRRRVAAAPVLADAPSAAALARD
jgi:hypothetical protein